MLHVSQNRAVRPFVLVRHDPVYGRLEIREQRKPDSSPGTVRLAQNAIVGQRVIIQEETRGYVERNENVDGVMLVCREYKEDGKYIHDPTDRMQHRDSARRVFSDKKVEKGDYNSVPTEHVISTRPYALQRHSKARPNDQSSLDL